MDSRKKYYLLIDTETAGTIDKPLVYDLGLQVIDKKGNVYYEDSFMIADYFIHNKELLDSCYFCTKIPTYWKEYKEHKHKLVRFKTAHKIVNELIKTYNIKKMYAYNARFDYRALNNTIKELSNRFITEFFPKDFEIHDIMKLAKQVLFTQKTFVKFAEENNLYTPSGKWLSNTAETAKKYIDFNPYYAEEHTGLEDVKIEKEILVKCWRQHKSIDGFITRV